MGFAFNSISFECPDASGKEEKLKAEWKQLGWTLVGIPVGGGLISDTLSDRFHGLKERYEWAKIHKSQLVELDKQFNSQGNMDIIMNLGHYSIALKAVLDSQEARDIEWTDEHLDLVKKAWQFAVWIREMYTDAEEKSGYEYFGNDAIPRPATQKQRLAMRLFIYKMNWHELPGFKNFVDYLRKIPPSKPMLIAGVVR